MRRSIPLAGIMALLVPLDRSFAFITAGDPIIEVLLGAAVIFLGWLFLLWEDLAQSTAVPEYAAGKDIYKAVSDRSS